MNKIMSNKSYVYNDSDMEEMADSVKAAIMTALVSECIMDEKTADQWCADHTIIKRGKTFFRTISDIFRNTKEEPGAFYWLVMRKAIGGLK